MKENLCLSINLSNARLVRALLSSTTSALFLPRSGVAASPAPSKKSTDSFDAKGNLIPTQHEHSRFQRNSQTLSEFLPDSCAGKLSPANPYRDTGAWHLLAGS